ncbi:MAG: hypothetical protein ACUVWR_00705 [Anaerolineae bacterium]
MSTQQHVASVNESQPRWPRLVTVLDRWLLAGAVAILAFLIFTTSRANIVADSVDYYAILQWVTPAKEKPIVRNLHFAEQRSPGYSLVAVIPYALLTLGVEPFVSTKKVGDTSSWSEPGPIPPMPLLLRDIPFKDFYVPGEDSWFQWKLVLALALTSYLFLFLGIAASAWTLRMEYPALPGYGLVPLVIFSSVIFVRNIFFSPLYATLTAYGTSSLFTLFFVKGYVNRRTRDILIAGCFLGLMVLTRLETGLIAGALVLLLFARSEWTLASRLLLGALWALLVWGAYNLMQFGTPLYLGILRGDINVLIFDIRYIADGLVHPSSGIVFWSSLLMVGVVGLLLSRSTPLRMMGISSLALLALCLIRVPIMYQHVGSGPINIGGILVLPPPSMNAMRELVRSDINRYVTVLAPFSVLGLRDAIGRVWERRVSHLKRQMDSPC